ncbi:MAG: HlyD family secretion protein [Prevotellaceae bacterium]|jgi:multidrug resistance efflux pump|nr:HlyD family secretion protein [Prevotellaceae bacterium]
MKKKKNLSKKTEAENSESAKPRRSEEIAGIVERMPVTFGRWVAVAVVIFAALLFFFGYIIKYPDTVTGQIRINSTNASARLVANVSGNIKSLYFSPRDDIKKGEYIAVIQNSAVTDDVKNIIEKTGKFDPYKPVSKAVNMFPEQLSLGDLNLDYHTFLAALKNRYDYEKDNVFEKQRKMLRDNMAWREKLLEESDSILKTTMLKLDISKKWFAKYSENNAADEKVVSDRETDISKNEYLSLKQEVQNHEKEISSVRMQIIENQNRLAQLNVEQKEKERQLQLDLFSSFSKLVDNLKSWEQKFVFKAPFDGKVEFLKFVTENQFIQAGEEIFGIIPTENNVFGQMLLPTTGAGKVSTGDRVTIKLDNYPYMEYGSIEGVVSSISLLSQVQKSERGTVNTYFVIIDLPHGLQTNYGEQLDFEYEISGQADIIVKERRLIERLFDNLKYRTR